MQQLLIWLKNFNKKFILLSLLFISKMKSEDHCGGAISYRVPQHTKKLDCPAEITMREVVMFLSFKVGRCETKLFSQQCYPFTLKFCLFHKTFPDWEEKKNEAKQNKASVGSMKCTVIYLTVRNRSRWKRTQSGIERKYPVI